MKQSKLQLLDLYSLEQYSKLRPQLRKDIIEHKKRRIVGVGPNATWLFEDRKTVQYQIQEMLRVERIFEEELIKEELDTYNPLIPDGSNWKVTLLIEFSDPEERRVQLGRLRGVEDCCWVQVADGARVLAIADEDLERENDEKTSAVHFLRFELPPQACIQIKSGAAISIGIDHENYRHSIHPLPTTVRDSLATDIA